MKILLSLLLMALSFQAFSDTAEDLSESTEQLSLSEKKGQSFPFGYFVSVGTSILSRSTGKPAFLEGDLNVLISKETWRYHELFLNFHQQIGGKLMLELIPRLFYSFFIAGLNWYSGIGIGFGFRPYHTYSENKNIGQILSFSSMTFTGLKAPNIYNNFGFFLEFSLVGGLFPFHYSG
ncbi:MAG: hypothetical protein OXJ52_06970, partial [Oligoflexia bacterium]|nr:hypothetical protein [Oligoflexia bacterium]